jgi:hypothetical protein
LIAWHPLRQAEALSGGSKLLRAGPLGAAAVRPSSKVTFTDVGDSERVNPSIAVEVSIGEVSTFELLSAAVFGTGYCGRSSLEATLLIPTAALSSSREVNRPGF